MRIYFLLFGIPVALCGLATIVLFHNVVGLFAGLGVVFFGSWLTSLRWTSTPSWWTLKWKVTPKQLLQYSFLSFTIAGVVRNLLTGQFQAAFWTGIFIYGSYRGIIYVVKQTPWQEPNLW